MLETSTDQSGLDIDAIHAFLSRESTWALGISRAVVEKSIANSLCFGGYEDGRLVAFARVISDFATFANLVDVFVLASHRGRGHGKAMVAAVMAHPDLQGLRRFTLATSEPTPFTPASASRPSRSRRRRWSATTRTSIAGADGRGGFGYAARSSTLPGSEPMKRVTGIGGIFIAAKDPAALRAWYKAHLGIDVQEWGGAAFSWSDDSGKPVGGTTIWSAGDGSYFAPGPRLDRIVVRKR